MSGSSNSANSASAQLACSTETCYRYTTSVRLTLPPGAIGNVSGPDFEKSTLIPVIAQDHATGEVLMLAYMNRAAYEETLQTARVCYFSRSRQKLWRKGEESGHVQHLKEIYFDCDADTLLVKVEQVGGAACHEGYKSCFFRKIDPESGRVEVIGERVFDPAEIYKKG